MTSEETKVSGISRTDSWREESCTNNLREVLCSLKTRQRLASVWYVRMLPLNYQRKLESQEYFLFPSAKLETLIFHRAMSKVLRRVLQN